MFEEVVGNSSIVLQLQGLLAKKNKFPHAVLLHGATGCGKTTIGRIIAQALGAGDNGLTEIDSAQFRGIDTVRDIRKNMQFTALGAAVKVYLIDEIQKMTNDAQNAFLKALEDTPSHVYFILCTTDPQKLIPAVRGRCSSFQVNPLTEEEMLKLLKRITKAEGEKLEQEVYDEIIVSGQGHPRNTINILQQVLSVPEKKRLNVAKQAVYEQAEALELCRALFAKQLDWDKIRKILTLLRQQEAEAIRRAVLGYATNVALNGGINNRTGLILEEFTQPFFDTGFPQLVKACYVVCSG